MSEPSPEFSLDRDQSIALVVAQLIASERDGGEAVIVSIPEEEDRTNPAVELITRDSVGSLAIEHTRIEPYSGQIQDDQQLRPYTDALPKLLVDRLPLDSRFNLNLNLGATDGIKPKPATFEKIAEWVTINAPLLELGRPGVDGRHMTKGGPPEIPFPVTLVRWQRRSDDVIPQLTLGRWKPNDLEERRQERLRVALRTKLPKLATAAGEVHQGVLVIESNDIQLSNHFDIGVALRDVAATCETLLPSWIVLWEQFDKVAFVSFPRVSGTWVGDPVPFTLPGIELGSSSAGGR